MTNKEKSPVRYQRVLIFPSGQRVTDQGEIDRFLKEVNIGDKINVRKALRRVILDPDLLRQIQPPVVATLRNEFITTVAQSAKAAPGFDSETPIYERPDVEVEFRIPPRKEETLELSGEKINLFLAPPTSSTWFTLNLGNQSLLTRVTHPVELFYSHDNPGQILNEMKLHVIGRLKALQAK